MGQAPLSSFPAGGETGPSPVLGPLVLELKKRLEGEVRFDDGSRGLYARDASNFRMVPVGVVIPKHAEDVEATLDACRRRGVPVVARGGGTSLAGQCCNAAVVMDFTKYMNRVIEIDAERRLARVQPGVVLDDLRRASAPYGLTFGPDPATHNHCTLGGMIGNNACGIHAVLSEFYGPGARVQDNVEALEILTYDGTRMQVGETSEAELERMTNRGDRQGDIYRRLRALRDRHATEIRRRFPDIPRRVSGYNLPCLLPERGFNVAQALVGTEGTCVTVLEATLRLVPALPHRALLVLGFDTVEECGDAIPEIRSLRDKPIGCEGLDARLVADIQKKGLHAEYLTLLPKGGGWLLVQFGASEEGEAERMAERALAQLGRKPTDHRLYTDADTRKEIWELRESGLGATAFVPGQHDTWPGWEDSAVPPEKVGTYLRELKKLFQRYGFEASLYGHFAQGCIHTRLPFDFTSEAGLRQYRRFTREAAELVVGMGGSLSGEHGDGQQRADLLPIMFGEQLVGAFREFKAIWDPDWKMNPGKVVDPYPRTSNLLLSPDESTWEPETHFPFADDDGRIAHAALRCVGVGKCRRTVDEGVMCPSFMVLHEEEHTTRGRAHLLFEMLRGEVITDGWKSEEVKASLDLCLACKGCTHDCPVNVDIPTLKAEFLSHYYEGRLRPRHAHAFGQIDRWARVAALVPELANFVTQTPGISRMAKWAADIHPDRTIPTVANQTFRAWFERRGRPHGVGRRVMLWPDTFNNYFHPETLAAAVDVLIDAGCEVVIPGRVLCCGRPLYDYGMLKRAEGLWRRTLGELEEEIRAGTPLIGVEPSCTAAFRDELINLRPNDPLAQKLAGQTLTLAEFLTREVPGWRPPQMRGRKALVHFHCHHHAVMGEHVEKALFEKMGLDVDRPQTTCCGMAGPFGFQRDHYDLSMAVGEIGLLPAARRAPDGTLLIADGFSCRTQVEEATGRRPLHLAEVLQLARRHEQHRIKPETELEAIRPRSVERRVSTGAKVLVGAAVLLLGGVLATRLRGDRSA